MSEEAVCRVCGLPVVRLAGYKPRLYHPACFLAKDRERGWRRDEWTVGGERMGAFKASRTIRALAEAARATGRWRGEQLHEQFRFSGWRGIVGWPVVLEKYIADVTSVCDEWCLMSEDED